MEAPVLMAAQTVPTSARYIDKLTTVGTCSASGGNEATGPADCSPSFHDGAGGPETRRSPNSCGGGTKALGGVRRLMFDLRR